MAFKISYPASTYRIDCKNTKVNWTEEQETSFNEIKKIIEEKTLLAYPDFSKKFIIHSEESDYQLGGAMIKSFFH